MTLVLLCTAQRARENAQTCQLQSKLNKVPIRVVADLECRADLTGLDFGLQVLDELVGDCFAVPGDLKCYLRW